MVFVYFALKIRSRGKVTPKALIYLIAIIYSYLLLIFLNAVVSPLFISTFDSKVVLRAKLVSSILKIALEGQRFLRKRLVRALKQAFITRQLTPLKRFASRDREQTVSSSEYCFRNLLIYYLLIGGQEIRVKIRRKQESQISLARSLINRRVIG